ncbi:hypothetical protein GDO86_014376 [Hymenochirus boettgeri]|uniref:BRCT domain-containing protein n=1 Tax=Hymenochirus boettgeri TaxID=247094 RepID=A0A8T2JSS3_9PIPI|nr:hypothetical protein GDO86_014376 [Hymenochirus boettgeri]
MKLVKEVANLNSCKRKQQKQMSKRLFIGSDSSEEIPFENMGSNRSSLSPHPKEENGLKSTLNKEHADSSISSEKALLNSNTSYPENQNPQDSDNSCAFKQMKQSIQRVNEWFTKTPDVLNTSTTDEDALAENKEPMDGGSCSSDETERSPGLPMQTQSSLLGIVDKQKISAKNNIFCKVYKRDRKPFPPFNITCVAQIHCNGSEESTHSKVITKSPNLKRRRKTVSTLQPKDFVKQPNIFNGNVSVLSENSDNMDCQSNANTFHSDLIQNKNAEQVGDQMNKHPTETFHNTSDANHGEMFCQRGENHTEQSSRAPSHPLDKTKGLGTDSLESSFGPELYINSYPSNEPKSAASEIKIRRSLRLQMLPGGTLKNNNFSAEKGGILQTIDHLLNSNPKEDLKDEPCATFTPDLKTSEDHDTQIDTIHNADTDTCKAGDQSSIFGKPLDCCTHLKNTLQKIHTETKDNDIENHLFTPCQTTYPSTTDNGYKVNFNSETFNKEHTEVDIISQDECIITSNENQITPLNSRTIMHKTKSLFYGKPQPGTGPNSPNLPLDNMLQNSSEDTLIQASEVIDPLEWVDKPKKLSTVISIKSKKEHINEQHSGLPQLSFDPKMMQFPSAIYKNASTPSQGDNKLCQNYMADNIPAHPTSLSTGAIKNLDIFSDTPDGLLSSKNMSEEDACFSKADNMEVNGEPENLTTFSSGASKYLEIYSDTPDGLLSSKHMSEEVTCFSKADNVENTNHSYRCNLAGRGICKTVQKLKTPEEESHSDELPCFQDLLYGKAPNQSSNEAGPNTLYNMSPVRTQCGILSVLSNCVNNKPFSSKTSMAPLSQESQCSLDLFSSQSDMSSYREHKQNQLKIGLASPNKERDNQDKCDHVNCPQDLCMEHNTAEVAGCEREASHIEDSSILSSQGDILSTQQQEAMQYNLKKLQQEMAVLEAVLEQETDPSSLQIGPACPDLITSMTAARDSLKPVQANTSNEHKLSPENCNSQDSSCSPVETLQLQQQSRNSLTIATRPASSTSASPAPITVPSTSFKSPLPSSRKNLSFVASGLNQHELVILQRFARKTRSALSSHITETTTHIIIKTDAEMVCERTLKYFLGIAARKWVVSYEWIVQSIKAGRVLDEYDYEVNGDVINGRNHRGPRRSRLGSDGMLLRGFEICCLGSFSDMTLDDLEKMVSLCGATVVKTPQLFKNKLNTSLVIVQQDAGLRKRNDAEFKKNHKALVVTREWLLDSVATYRIQKFDGYLV